MAPETAWYHDPVRSARYTAVWPGEDSKHRTPGQGGRAAASSGGTAIPPSHGRKRTREVEPQRSPPVGPPAPEVCDPGSGTGCPASRHRFRILVGGGREEQSFPDADADGLRPESTRAPRTVTGGRSGPGAGRRARFDVKRGPLPRNRRGRSVPPRFPSEPRPIACSGRRNHDTKRKALFTFLFHDRPATAQRFRDPNPARAKREEKTSNSLPLYGLICRNGSGCIECPGAGTAPGSPPPPPLVDRLT
jgi:hypothetical protein